jgi:hypothetical protein
MTLPIAGFAHLCAAQHKLVVGCGGDGHVTRPPTVRTLVKVNASAVIVWFEVVAAVATTIFR